MVGGRTPAHQPRNNNRKGEDSKESEDDEEGRYGRKEASSYSCVEADCACCGLRERYCLGPVVVI
jgi:hypothetical protein